VASWNWSNRANAYSALSYDEATLHLGVGAISGEDWFSFDATNPILRLAPTAIGGGGQPNYGFILVNAYEGASNAGRGVQFFSRNKGAGFTPYLVITYTPNTAPNAPLNITPADGSTSTTTSPTVSGSFDDNDTGDTMSGAQVRWFSDVSGTLLVWDSGDVAATGVRFNIQYNGSALTSGDSYWFDCRTRDQSGLWGAYSALNEVTINSLPYAPIVTVTQQPNTDIGTLTPQFVFSHQDPDPADVLAYAYRYVVERLSGTSWVAHNDSGDITLGTPVSSVAITYNGNALSWASTYRVKAATKDVHGGWGAYSIAVQFSTHQTATPINLIPTGNAIVGSTTPKVSGQRGSSLDVFTKVDLRFWNGVNLDIPEMTDITSGVTSAAFSCVPDQSLSADSALTWQVRAYASLAGWSAWSASQSFRTPSANAVNITAPLGSGITDLTPDIAFNRSTNFDAHQVEVRRKSDQVSMWAPGTDTYSSRASHSVTYAGTALVWATEYEERVRCSADGGSTWGAGWTDWQTFRTNEADVPTLTAPTVDLWTTDTTPNIAGTTTGTISQFRVLVWPVSTLDGTPSYDSGWVGGSGTSFSHDPTTALIRGRDYWVQAQYIAASGPTSPLSAARRFHVNAAPSQPTDVYPSSNTVVPSDLTPTLRATFTDDEAGTWGDYPTKWRIEVIRESDQNSMLAAEYTTGLTAGENTKVYAGSALSYQIWYQARHKFWDTKSEAGTFSPYYRFKCGRPGTVTITEYTDDQVVTPAFTIQWDWSHPDSLVRTRYQAWITRNSDGVKVYDSGLQISAALSHIVPSGYIRSGQYYTLHLVVYDSDYLPSIEQTYSVLATWASPDGVQSVSATYDETKFWLQLDWDAISDSDFDYYQIYRRRVGEAIFLKYDTVESKTTTTFIDYWAGHGEQYEYYLTWFAQVAGDQSEESGASQIVTASVDADTWVVISKDRTTVFELPVVDEQHQPVIQQETFEPLGGNRKKIVRGNTLGEEGWLECAWIPDERGDAKENIRYITNFAGPHILKSAFGDVWLVEFSAPTKRYRAVGAYTARLEWIEVDTI